MSVLLRAVAAEGGDAEQLKARFHLSAPEQAAVDARISIPPRFMRLGHAAIKATGGNPALGGLRMGGALSRPVDAGMAGGLAAETAGTVAGGALELLVRYSLLTSHNSRGGAPSFQRAMKTVSFYSIRPPYNQYNYFVVDSVLAAWTQLIRHMTGRYDVLERVRIEYPSIGQDDLFESWFRCLWNSGGLRQTISGSRMQSGNWYRHRPREA